MNIITFIKLLEFTQNLKELAHLVNSFRLLDKTHQNLVFSRDGRIGILQALNRFQLTPDEIDCHIVRCMETKNLFMLEMFLSLPQADVNLLIYESPKAGPKHKTVRRVNFCIEKITVYKQQRLSPLLHFAIENFWVAGVQLLLERTAYIFSEDYFTQYVPTGYGRNVVTNSYQFIPGGRQPIHVAAMRPLGNFIKYLTKQHGHAGGHEAALTSNAKIFSAVIHKQNVNAIDENGYTPLHVAVENHNDDAVEMLLGHGADVNCETKQGVTALKLAMIERNAEAIEMLIAHEVSMPSVSYLSMGLSLSSLAVVTEYIKQHPKTVSDLELITEMANSVLVCHPKDLAKPDDYLAFIAPDPNEFIKQVMLLIPSREMLQHFLQIVILRAVREGNFDLVEKLLRLGTALSVDLDFDQIEKDIPAPVLLDVYRDQKFRIVGSNGEQLLAHCTNQLNVKKNRVKTKNELLRKIELQINYHLALAQQHRYPNEINKKIELLRDLLHSIPHKAGFKDRHEYDTAERYIEEINEVSGKLQTLLKSIQKIRVGELIRNYHERDRGVFRRTCKFIPDKTRTVRQLQVLHDFNLEINQDEIIRLLQERDERKSRFRRTHIKNAVTFFQTPTQLAPKKLSATDRVIVGLRELFAESEEAVVVHSTV